jgi:hypothetical protein
MISYLAALVYAGSPEVSHRLDLLETNQTWHQRIVIAVAVFLGLTSLAGFFALWSRVKKTISSRVKKQVDEQTKDAVQIVRVAKDELERWRTSAAAGIHIETGEREFIFHGGNYASGFVEFATPFERVPQVFLTEFPSGEWLYPKVDEKSVNKFKIAVRTLTGAPSHHTTRIQWLAIETGAVTFPMTKPQSIMPSPRPTANQA